MILLRKPDQEAILGYLARQSSAVLSYAEVGASLAQAPAGYAINHTRRRLGRGEATFEAACSGLQAWCQLQLGWVRSAPLEAPLREGEHVAVIGRAFGLWWVNACRIVYVVDEVTTTRRFGYAHGTLPDHLARGEERFLIEMDADGTVWLDIYAFSRPQSWLARLGYPYMRKAQKRFGRESADAVARFVAAYREQDTSNANASDRMVVGSHSAMS